MFVRDVFNPNVITARPDWSVSRVIELMLEENVSSLVIVDEHERPVGIVTESPLLVATMDAQLRGDPISLHMRRDFVEVGPDEPLNQIVEKFLLHRVRHFPVVAGKRLLGILTRRDLMRAILGQKAKQ